MKQFFLITNFENITSVLTLYVFSFSTCTSTTSCPQHSAVIKTVSTGTDPKSREERNVLILLI
jgi:cytochrome oxidase Cu insertion factor (SCO1/SenC/PrrC family)